MLMYVLCLQFAVCFFIVQCYASTVYAVITCMSVCFTSVPLSVTSRVLSKRLNVGSHKQCHTIAQRLYVF